MNIFRSARHEKVAIVETIATFSQRSRGKKGRYKTKLSFETASSILTDQPPRLRSISFNLNDITAQIPHQISIAVPHVRHCAAFQIQLRRPSPLSEKSNADIKSRLVESPCRHNVSASIKKISKSSPLLLTAHRTWLPRSAASDSPPEPRFESRLEPNTQISNFKIEKRLGPGGMGTVYQARSCHLIAA